MFSLAFISAAASGGSGVIPNAPTLSHGSTAGTFTINNYDSSLRYVISAGTRNGNTIDLGTSSTVQCTVVAYTQKGAISSSSAICERMNYTYSYVQTGTAPGSCNYLPASCGCCSNPSGGLCIFCSGGGPIYGWVKDSTPSGYTDSYGEWWKIS